MTENFYNPYQFIPVTGLQDDSPRTVPFADIKQGNHAAIRHDLWQKNLKSGRIVCSVHLETPTVVGNQHDQPAPGEDRETKVHPYRIGGEYALPANSLRGMIGSVAETLSQSALRVLEEEKYSVRREVGKGLSAIGCIRKETSNQTTRYFLRPLSLPTVSVRLGRQLIFEQKWTSVFGRDSRIIDWLPAYVDGYKFDERTKRNEYLRDDFLSSSIVSAHFGKPRFYYARLSSDLARIKIDSELDINQPALHIKPNMRDGRTVGYSLLGQRITGKDIINQAHYDGLSAEAKVEYTRGVLFVLGIEGREGEIPKTKHHERFIPTPPSKTIKDKELEIPKSIVDRFLETAEARNKCDKALPFLPQGYDGISTREWLVANGDLVYFDIDKDGRVTEISYSSIWRQAIDGTIHDAFSAISHNLVPWGYGDRRNLTPAEYLFGVVEGQKKRESPDSKNLASRIRFSDARSPDPVKLMNSGIDDGWFRLKILSSPKPPSPAMYFAGGPRKSDLTAMAAVKPNGRKYYLPHRQSSNWVSKNNDHPEQKCFCQPIPAGTRFYFHIDFDNLTDAELQLLLTAVNPGEGFNHRLGLGKPLGLGSVKIRHLGIFLIDRVARYSATALGGDEQRYAFHVPGTWDIAANSLYPVESLALGLGLPPHSQKVEETLIDSVTLELLNTVGNPARQKPNTRIHYPYCTLEQVQQETEGYEWFVSNDDRRNTRYNLKKVEKNQELPFLLVQPRPHRR